jgi:flagellar biosynthesis regulator FlaF
MTEQQGKSQEVESASFTRNTLVATCKDTTKASNTLPTELLGKLLLVRRPKMKSTTSTGTGKTTEFVTYGMFPLS